MPSAGSDASDAALDANWCVAGFVFDNQRNVAIAYLDGQAEEYWIEDGLDNHPFFQWPAKAWKQAQLRKLPGLQEGEDPGFPEDQLYSPPEDRPSQRKRITANQQERVFELTFAFTRVRVTEHRTASGGWEVKSRELVALKANPFWFGHDLYKPRLPEEGGPFTIGRVIHSSRGVGTVALIGGVAVYHRALREAEMRKLARIGIRGKGANRRWMLLQAPGMSRTPGGAGPLH
ncbi:MAG: hypothetical protein MUF01_05200 [Bryobacterales bacterium]|jgi:hypothetical protein|nr:hypothetical protein [Bryobacterales bacterium]